MDYSNDELRLSIAGYRRIAEALFEGAVRDMVVRRTNQP